MGLRYRDAMDRRHSIPVGAPPGHDEPMAQSSVLDSGSPSPSGRLRESWNKWLEGWIPEGRRRSVPGEGDGAPGEGKENLSRSLQMHGGMAFARTGSACQPS